jgi:hypothetical protein
MRRASRFMPKLVRTPPTLVGWMLLIAFGASLLCVLWLHPIVTSTCLSVLVALSWLHQRDIRNHLRTMAASRAGESICTFSREVDCRNVDKWIVRAVYEEIQERLTAGCAKFPLRWTDRLKEDLRIDPDALDEELAIDIAQRTGRSLEVTERNPLFGEVKTVRDLVLFFQAQPQLQESKAPPLGSDGPSREIPVSFASCARSGTASRPLVQLAAAPRHPLVGPRARFNPGHP